MPSTQTEVTFIAGEFWPTQNGKDRWKLRANDGREFGCWSQTVYDAVMQHLHQSLMCDVGSKQSDTGTWWNTLYGVPALGVQAEGPPKQGPQGGTPLGAAVDNADMVAALNRIAAAIENMLAFQASRFMAQPAPVVGGTDDEGPQEPPEA